VIAVPHECCPCVERLGYELDRARLSHDRLRPKYEAAEAENERLRAVVAAADEMLAWIAKTHPKVLREMPRPIYQRVRKCSAALAELTEGGAK
jgi:hypothetical protein